MIWIEGIHLMGENEDELHEMARKFVISKSWFSSKPSPRYSIVYPLKLDEMVRYLNKKK